MIMIAFEHRAFLFTLNSIQGENLTTRESISRLFRILVGEFRPLILNTISAEKYAQSY